MSKGEGKGRMREGKERLKERSKKRGGIRKGKSMEETEGGGNRG